MKKNNLSVLSHRGKKRINNEDAAYAGVSQYGLVMAIADGIGGLRGGEVASKCATDTLALNFAKVRSELNLRSARKLLKDSAKEANKSIINIAKRNSDGYQSDYMMGTTIVSACLTKEGVIVINAGDSRAYSYTKLEGLKQITVDDSLIELYRRNGTITNEEAKNHPDKNIILNALGLRPNLIGLKEYKITEDIDALLLCSDGLFNLVSDEEIENILSCDKTTQEKGQMLIDAALNAGGTDNVAISLWEK